MTVLADINSGEQQFGYDLNQDGNVIVWGINRAGFDWAVEVDIPGHSLTFVIPTRQMLKSTLTVPEARTKSGLGEKVDQVTGERTPATETWWDVQAVRTGPAE